MKTINCKRCGFEMDVSLGECPNCGAVYYILEEGPQNSYKKSGERGPVEKAPAFGGDKAPDPEGTRAFVPVSFSETRQTRDQYGKEKQRSGGARRQEVVGEKGGKLGKFGSDKRPLIVAAVALLAVITLIITIMSGAFDFNKGEKATMPYVVGMNESVAFELLEGLELKVEVQKQYSERPEGEVIEQNIREGKGISKGDKVTIIVSNGLNEEILSEIEYVTVPSLVGKSYDRALYELVAIGLVLTKGEDEFSERPEGEILSQRPAAGTELRKGDLVTVVLSKGLEPSPEPETWEISVTAGTGGSVSPKGLVTVEDGEDQTFVITPNEGYEIGEVKVDGNSVGAVSEYTFTQVTSDHSLYVVFRVKAVIPSPEAPMEETPLPSEEVSNETLSPEDQAQG